jgi:tetratricopeptide (TPR) repeat protein
MKTKLRYNNSVLILLVALFSLVFLPMADSQSAHKNLRSGDMLYGFGKYPEAETEYRKAESASPSFKSNYNLGNTLMNQERYDEAVKKYDNATSYARTDEEKATAYYNQGNALYKKEKFKESIDAYKKSLKYQPSDQLTKENLALARRALQKQQQQQQKDKQNQDKKQDQKDNKDQNQNQQNNQDQNKNNDQQNQNEQQNNQNNTPQDEQNKPSQSDKKMNRQDAKKLLEIMDNEEKKVQQKLRRMDAKGGKPKKDW